MIKANVNIIIYMYKYASYYFVNIVIYNTFTK